MFSQDAGALRVVLASKPVRGDVAAIGIASSPLLAPVLLCMQAPV